jgi:serine/threonine protein kinase
MAETQAVAETSQSPSGRIAPFGKYLLLQRVSVGGMAEVFKALPQGATRIDQIVAIKRILPNIAEDSEFIGMFIDEARIAGQLTHQNICRIYELGRVGGDHYIAMQFLWGRDLLKVMNRFKKAGQPLPPPMAAFIAAKACAALHYAHFKHDQNGEPLNIIHRDVSPQNIIVGYSGNVKLIDFGVARAASQSQKTQAGILKGKFGYMSPEMIRGLPVDHRSDVFAMGICLHEALTGSRLFYGDTDFATLELVRDARVMPPSAKVTGIPPALDAIVLKALSRDTEHRYATAQELEIALEAFVSSHYPGYGEAEVGQMMRQAFANEVQREKQRVEIFSDMLERGELVRGASLPPLASDPPPASGERAAAGSPGRRGRASLLGEPLDITVEDPEVPGDPAAGSDADDAPQVEDERTQIFFSAEELDEIREIDRQPLGPADELAPMRQPAPSDVIMRGGLWSPSHMREDGGSVRNAATSGTYNKVHRDHAPGYGRDQRRIPTLAMDAFNPAAHGLAPSSSPGSTPQKRDGFMRTVALIALTALLVVGGYAAARVAMPQTGTLEIAAVGAPDALVRVDGVVRGNPPLIVEDLAAGSHRLEIEAKGYELAQKDVQVASGSITPVSVVLERSMQPEVAHLNPVVEPKPAANTGAGSPKITPFPSGSERPNGKKRGHSSEAPAQHSEALAGNLGTAGPAPAPEPAPAAPVAADGTGGELLISTLPWSHVFVDGNDTGRDTPVRALHVSEGAHRIGLRTPDGLTHFVDVFVEPGQVVRIIRRF